MSTKQKNNPKKHNTMNATYITPNYNSKFNGITCSIIANLMALRYGAIAGGNLYEEGKTYYNNVPVSKELLYGEIIPELAKTMGATEEEIKNDIIFNC